MGNLDIPVPMDGKVALIGPGSWIQIHSETQQIKRKQECDREGDVNRDYDDFE